MMSCNLQKGKEDELVGRIQKRTGQAKEQVEAAIKECAASSQPEIGPELSKTSASGRWPEALCFAGSFAGRPASLGP